MLQRQRSGSVICTSCGVLVGVNDDECYNCHRRNPGLWGFAPALRALGADLGFVPFVLGTCIVLYVLTLAATIFLGRPIVMNGLFGFLGPSFESLFVFGATGPRPVFIAGRWWTLLSASWLHASLLHIVFNMMAVRQLAPAVADMYGPARMVIIYVASGVAGFLLSVLWGAYLPPIPLIGGGDGITIGASASISGLLGAIYHFGNRGGSSMAKSYATSAVLMLLLQGIFLAGIINNLAHIGGLIGGYLTSKALDPLKRERVDHIVIALVCLGLSLLSVLVSILHGIQFLRAA